MNMTPQQAAAIKREYENLNKQKEQLIDSVIKRELEAGTLKGNIFDRTRELWKQPVGQILELAAVVEKVETPSTKGKAEGKKELSLADKVEKGEIDLDRALELVITDSPLFKFE